MEEQQIASFLIILLLEIFLASDVIFHSHSMVKFAGNNSQIDKFKLYLSIIIFKYIFILLLFFAGISHDLFFNAFGFKIYISRLCFFLSGIFLLSKNLAEFYEIYNLKPKTAKPNKEKKSIPKYGILKHIIYFAFLISFESFSLATSVTTSIAIILSANILGTVLAKKFPAFFVRLFNRFYRFRLIFILFSILLGVNLLLHSLSHQIEIMSLVGILVFTILCEVVSIICSRRHIQTGVKK